MLLGASLNNPGVAIASCGSIEFDVTLFRGSRGFGFSVRGGNDVISSPLTIVRISAGCAAHMDGRLQVRPNVLLKKRSGYSLFLHWDLCPDID
ncbi:unnamed protein product [Protopolystoma xenopodis]|uniref:PDZ domain-containing protein n=1 Tax=Protopolystoma xenopodis TaxID=117903 RepID=A0A448WLE0_9PLAT|nr:unnamed protein product [Protopolystoma xenopodis]